MTRNRLFKLKIVDDLAVTEETEKADILWRIRPLLVLVKHAVSGPQFRESLQ